LDKGFNLPADIKEIKIYGSEDAIPLKFKNAPEFPKNNEE